MSSHGADPIAAKLTRVVLATTNRGKLDDFRALFDDTGIDLVSPADVGVSLEVEETGETFVDNALLKARAHVVACRMPALADDSGIVAHALGNEPGVRSARYAGEPSDDHANNLKLIAPAPRPSPIGAHPSYALSRSYGPTAASSWPKAGATVASSTKSAA